MILNKLNRDNVIVYKEYELHDGTYKYSDDSFICNIDELVELVDYAMKVNDKLCYSIKKSTKERYDNE